VACAAQGSSVRIDIADRGPGVPPRDRERIFEMFVSSRPEGTGLGLVLARTALRKCGGEIIARPREGGGSIFRITLPAGSETAS
jgi:two-component system sensor histidine kinase DctS